MQRFLISYDLSRPEEDYPKLLAQLKGLEAVRVLSSQWVVRLDDVTTCASVRTYFKDFLEGNDRLLVVAWTDPPIAAGWNLMAKISDI